MRTNIIKNTALTFNFGYFVHLFLMFPFVLRILNSHNLCKYYFLLNIFSNSLNYVLYAKNYFSSSPVI